MSQKWFVYGVKTFYAHAKLRVYVYSMSCETLTDEDKLTYVDFAEFSLRHIIHECFKNHPEMLNAKLFKAKLDYLYHSEKGNVSFEYGAPRLTGAFTFDDAMDKPKMLNRYFQSRFKPKYGLTPKEELREIMQVIDGLHTHISRSWDTPVGKGGPDLIDVFIHSLTSSTIMIDIIRAMRCYARILNDNPQHSSQLLDMDFPQFYNDALHTEKTVIEGDTDPVTYFLAMNRFNELASELEHLVGCDLNILPYKDMEDDLVSRACIEAEESVFFNAERLKRRSQSPFQPYTPTSD